MTKNYSFFLILALMLSSHLMAATIEEHYQEGEITIQEADAFDEDKQVVLRTGEEITFKIKVYQSDFFEKTIISANASIDNASSQKVQAIYSISFHDNEGKLVGCHQGSWELDPNADVNYGSGLIYANPESIATVTHYKLRTQVVEDK